MEHAQPSRGDSWEDIIHLENQLHGNGEEIKTWDEEQSIEMLNRLYAYSAYCLMSGIGVGRAYALANAFREWVFSHHPDIEIIVDPYHLGNYTTPKLLLKYIAEHLPLPEPPKWTNVQHPWSWERKHDNPWLPQPRERSDERQQ